MDSRVEILREELLTLPPDGAIDVTGYLDRICTLHSDLKVEADRVGLLGIRSTFLDYVERQVSAQNGNIDALVRARIAEDRVLCMVEAMDGPNLNPAELLRVVDREISAGRMQGSEDFRELAFAGATVLGGQTGRQRKKAGWFRGLLSRPS